MNERVNFNRFASRQKVLFELIKYNKSNITEKASLPAPWIAVTAAILLISGIVLVVRRRRV